ncbi:phage tail family protein, partial [Streptococcus anginosus]
MSKFTFKGVDLSPFLNILEIKRTIGNERILTTEDLVETGVDLQEVSYGAKIIKIKVALASRAMQSQMFVDTIEYPEIEDTNLNALREHVAMLLSAKKPYKLELPDEPNRFYFAIPKGDIELEGISDWYDQTTIDFFVPDGVAHTNVTKEFVFTKNSEGILEAEIDNQGSEEVSVNYRIKLKHESGYVGIVSQYGAMQFGKIEEADLVEEKKNVLLAANGKGDFKNWTDGTIFYENQNKKVVTTMSADSSFGGRLGLLPANFTNTANGAYFGAVKELKLSEQAKDWYIWARAWFETGLVSQTGAWCLSVVDSENKFIAGMAIEKSER